MAVEQSKMGIILFVKISTLRKIEVVLVKSTFIMSF